MADKARIAVIPTRAGIDDPVRLRSLQHVVIPFNVLLVAAKALLGKLRANSEQVFGGVEDMLIPAPAATYVVGAIPSRRVGAAPPVDAFVDPGPV